MDLDAAGVGLLDAVSEGIIAGRAPHAAGEPRTPRLHGRRINRIALGADLEDHCVDFEGGEFVEHRSHFRLLCACAEAGATGPVEVINARDPRPAEFPGKGGWPVIAGCKRLGGRTDAKQAGEKEKSQSVHGLKLSKEVARRKVARR